MPLPSSHAYGKKLGTYAMKRVAAGAHLPTPWLFELAKRPDIERKVTGTVKLYSWTTVIGRV